MRAHKDSTWFYYFCNLVVRLIMTLYHRMSVRGLKYVPRTGGAFIVSNHASFLDPMVMGSSILRRPVSFMARESLFKNPFLGWLFMSLKARPLDRQRGDVCALKLALSLINQGEMVGLFPEGTRTRDGELKEPKPGIGFLVAKAKVPVVPAYIDGTFTAWPRGARWPKPCKIRITYGPPIDPARFAALGKGKEAYRAAGELVMDEIRQLKNARA